MFYYRPQARPGEPRPKSIALRTKDLGKAILEAQAIRDGERVAHAAVEGTFDQVIKIYLEERAGDTRGTRRQRKMILASFRRSVGNVKVAGITEPMVRKWIAQVAELGSVRTEGDERKPKPVAKSTIKSYLVTLRAFTNWARRKGYLRVDPMEGFKRELRIRTSKVDSFLTVGQREAMLADADATEEVRFIMHFGFFQGLRLEEMLAMTRDWLWIDEAWSRGTVTVQATPIISKSGSRSVWVPKDKEKRAMPLHERTLDFLKGYGLREPWMLAPHKKFWPSAETSTYRYDPKKGLAGVGKRAGVGHVTSHMLRHSFGTHLAMAGVEMKTIAELLGDGLAVTEQHYIGYAPNKVNPLASL